MITDFLKTTRSKEELAAALAVLREFKSNESAEEWFVLSFQVWSKLEQLQEYLEYLVDSRPLKPDTLVYMSRKPNPDFKHIQKPG